MTDSEFDCLIAILRYLLKLSRIPALPHLDRTQEDADRDFARWGRVIDVVVED